MRIRRCSSVHPVAEHELDLGFRKLKYGIFLSDAGGTPLTAEIGAQSEIGALDLKSIRISDFEVLTLGTLIP